MNVANSVKVNTNPFSMNNLPINPFLLSLSRICNMIDVDYCKEGHECDENADCYNLKTTYMCKCKPGFQGDGLHCTGEFRKLNFT